MVQDRKTACLPHDETSFELGREKKMMEQSEAFRKEALEKGLIFYRQEEAFTHGKGVCHFFDLNQGSFFVPDNRKKITALIALAKRYGQGENEALLNQRILRAKLKDAKKPSKVWQPGNPYSEEVPPAYISLKKWLQKQKTV